MKYLRIYLDELNPHRLIDYSVSLGRFLFQAILIAIISIMYMDAVKPRVDAIIEAHNRIQDSIRPYQYKKTRAAFGRLDLSGTMVVAPEVLKNKILFSIPENIRMGANKYIEDILLNAQKYQVDPIWVLSIIWTESHFKPNSKSRVGARGLMQIMPNTGRYVSDMLFHISYGPFPKKVNLLYTPEYNIELGVYYLKYLLNKFNNNATYATVAYNMGPTWVKRNISRGRKVGVKNLYLKKVKSAYQTLSKSIATL